MTGPELAAKVGATYRQIDHWTTLRYLRARKANPGSGQPRSYTPRESEVPAVMVQLTREGVEPKTAARVARSLVSKGAAHLGRRYVIRRAA